MTQTGPAFTVTICKNSSANPKPKQRAPMCDAASKRPTALMSADAVRQLFFFLFFAHLPPRARRTHEITN